MFETIRNEVAFVPLLVFVSFLFLVGGVGPWYVRKTTGRPIREMLGVLAAAIAFIVLTAPIVVHYSKNPADRGHVPLLGLWAFMAIGVLVWWAFNKLAPGQTRKNRPHDHTKLK